MATLSSPWAMFMHRLKESPQYLGRSTWSRSPLSTILLPLPMRVMNILICSMVQFWASSRMAKVLWKLRPRMNSSGHISIMPVFLYFSRVGDPKYVFSSSMTGTMYGWTFSSMLPGRYPTPLPDSTTGRVITILSIVLSLLLRCWHASMTAMAVLPVPAGPEQKVMGLWFMSFM